MTEFGEHGAYVARELKRNRFKVDRTWVMYKAVLHDFEFGPSFESAVRALGPDGHWIDMGGGVAVPMMQYARARFNDDGSAFSIDPAHVATLPRLSVVVLSDDFDYAMKDAEDRYWPERFLTFRRDMDPERFRYYAGRPLEAYPDPARTFGLADVLTDVVATGAYTTDLTTVLIRHLQTLRVGGVGFLNGVFEATEIKDCHGHDMSPEAFLANIRGAEVTPGNVRAFDNQPHPRGRLRTFRMKRDEAPIWVPELKLVKLKKGLPPVRTFRMVDCVAGTEAGS